MIPQRAVLVNNIFHFFSDFFEKNRDEKKIFTNFATFLASYSVMWYNKNVEGYTQDYE